MNTVRRGLLLIPLTLAVIAGASVPAWATFDASATVPTTITSIAVAAPSSVTVNGYCSTSTSTTWTGTGWATTTSYWYSATVSWPASTTTRGVTGYRVMAYLNNGTSYVMAETSPTARTTSATVDRSYLNYQPRISVITLTSYGWTTESPKTPVLTC